MVRHTPESRATGMALTSRRGRTASSRRRSLARKCSTTTIRVCRWSVRDATAQPATTTRDSGLSVTGLIDHFERVLGPVHTGWLEDPEGAAMPFRIVRFSGGSDADSVGYATVGLSRTPLLSPVSGRPMRQELLMLAPDALPTDNVVSLLFQVGTMVLGSQRPLLRGNVIGPASSLVPGSELTALYVTMPVYFPDAFATFSDQDGDVVICWLAPITTPEADFVSRHGWDAFEDQLVEQDPDLVDFQRASLKL